MIDILRRIILEFQNRPFFPISPRSLDFPLLPGKATVITGMRRAGKTCFCYQKMQELMASGLDRTQILYLNFEDDRLLGFSLEHCQCILDAYYSLYPENREKKCYFFFDEIQNVENWERFVRRLLDTTDIQVILTGSSSKLLTSEIATAMRGRSISQEVLPFSFREFLRYHHVFDSIPEYFSDDDIARLRNEIEQYFALGGFPEIFAVPDQSLRFEILQEYSNMVILKDVMQRHKVTNTIALQYLMKNLYNNASQKFSVSKFYKVLSTGLQVKCARNDLYDFAKYLEEAYIIYRTELHAPSQKARMVNPNKIYLIDIGLVRAMAENPEANRGWLLENLVYLQLRRWKYAVSYYNTSSGTEVDFYVMNPVDKSRQLIQVSWSLADPKTAHREIQGLLDAGQELNIDRRLIVTWDEENTLDNGIRVLPIWKFLLMGEE